MPAAALVGGMMNMMSSAINNSYQSRENAKQFRRTKELMQMQNQMNIDNWNMQNEYNSPSAEIERLKKAGLNPDLMYGQGVGNLQGGSINSAGLGSAPDAITHPVDIASGAFQGEALASQIDVNNSVAEKNRADASKTNAETPWVSKLASSQIGLNSANVKQINEMVEKIRSDTELQRVLTDIQKRENEFQRILFDKKVSSTLAELGANEEKSKVIIDTFAQYQSAQIALLVAQSYNNYKQGQSAMQNAVSNRISANAAMYNAHTNRYSAKTDFIVKTRSLDLERSRTQFQNALAKSGIDLNNRKVVESQLVHQWREMLNEVPVIGPVTSSLLGIPGSLLGGSLNIK